MLYITELPEKDNQKVNSRWQHVIVYLFMLLSFFLSFFLYFFLRLVLLAFYYTISLKHTHSFSLLCSRSLSPSSFGYFYSIVSLHWLRNVEFRQLILFLILFFSYFHFVRSFVVSLFVILSDRLLLCTHFIVVETFVSFVIINCNIFVPLIVIVINLWLSKLSPHQIRVFQSNDIHNNDLWRERKRARKREHKTGINALLIVYPSSIVICKWIQSQCVTEQHKNMHNYLHRVQIFGP